MIRKYATKQGLARWEVEWRLPDRRKRRKVFTTEREARAWEARVRTDASVGVFHDPARARRTTVAVAYETWLASRVDLGAKTRRTYEDEWRLRVGPQFADWPLSRVTRPAIQDFVNHLVAGGTGPRMVRFSVTLLRQVLELAVRDEIIVKNPAKNIALPRLEARRHRFLTPDQIEGLARACGDQGDVVILLAFSGLRFGELAGLNVEDVDLSNMRLHVRRSVTQVGGKLLEGPPKTKAGRRSVPIPTRILRPLGKRLGGKAGDEPAIASPRGSRLCRENWVRDVKWREAAQSIGEPDLRIHDLRHTYAALSRAAGADLYLIARVMGHASITVTASTYADLFDSELSHVANALDGLNDSPLFSDSPPAGNDIHTNSRTIGPDMAHCEGQLDLIDELDALD